MHAFVIIKIKIQQQLNFGALCITNNNLDELIISEYQRMMK